jgi:hypothetical protein
MLTLKRTAGDKTGYDLLLRKQEQSLNGQGPKALDARSFCWQNRRSSILTHLPVIATAGPRQLKTFFNHG